MVIDVAGDPPYWLGVHFMIRNNGSIINRLYNDCFVLLMPEIGGNKRTHNPAQNMKVHD